MPRRFAADRPHPRPGADEFENSIRLRSSRRAGRDDRQLDAGLLAKRLERHRGVRRAPCQRQSRNRRRSHSALKRRENTFRKKLLSGARSVENSRLKGLLDGHVQPLRGQQLRASRRKSTAAERELLRPQRHLRMRPKGISDRSATAAWAFAHRSGDDVAGARDERRQNFRS